MGIAKIKKLTETAILPTVGSQMSAGMDLYADIPVPVTIASGATAMISTGIAVTPPEGTFGAIFARSGIATKRGLAPANKVGVCDEDYTGPYIVALHNHSNLTQIVEPGERIAQLIFIPYVKPEFEVVNELIATERGDGGFGHTGEK